MFAFQYDIKDVEENINAFDEWNPMIHEIFNATQNEEPVEIDSIFHKLGTVGNFIFFGQRSRSKIEELKFSPINLIENRDLKNKIILYQDERVDFIRVLEKRYDLVGEDIRKYYTKNFKGYNYGPAYPLDIKKLKKDNVYASLLYQRLTMNHRLRNNYSKMNEEQKEILHLLQKEIDENC